MDETRIICVFGSSSIDVDGEEYREARSLGRLLAEAGFVVMSGGYHGTMEAVSRGAKEGGGRVLGITSSIFDGRRLGANAWVDEEISKGDYLSRLQHLITENDGCIALAGSVGTLTEVFATWSLLQVGVLNPKPLILVGDRWKRTLRTLVHESFIPESGLSTIHAVSTPEEAVQVLIERLSRDPAK